MTINVWLMGGLCNQIFMIFATVSYAIDNMINFNLISHNDKTMNDTRTYWNNLLEGFKDNVNADTSEMYTYYEPSHTFNKIPDVLSQTKFKLMGYFQSHKYFQHNYDKIIAMMNLRDRQKEVKNKYSYFFDKKTIAMHFRIGDYYGLQYYHCIKTPQYYISALNTLEKSLKDNGENIEDYNILYFCQKGDIPVIHDYLNIIRDNSNKQYKFISIDHDIPDWEQLLLMSVCNHFIIANSTFSWFGAYFCEDRSKIVCYPSVWFGPGYTDKKTHDMFPSAWKMIVG
jgi:hypothetical protein